MSSPTGQGTQGTCEKGNVARIVDRLSKQDFSTLARGENVPFKANRAGVSGAAAVGVGGNGVISPFAESVSASDGGAADVLSDSCDGSTAGQRQSEERAVVRFSYAAQQPDELDLKEGDELAVLELAEDGWARGCILHSTTNPHSKGRSGLYPTNFVSTVSPTPTTQSAPVAAHPPISSHCKVEDSQPTELIQPISIGVPLSSATPATKTPSVLSSSATPMAASLLANGSGVVQSSNVLPSSLLKGGAAPTIAAGARRAMSTLVTPTTAAKLLESGEAPNSQKAKEFAKVLYNYEASNPDEISLSEGSVVTVVNRHCEEEDWFIAEHEGRRGLFPDNFVRFLDHGQMQVSPNAHPPSLPAKPSKFGGIATSSANAPQNVAVTPAISRSSVNALAKPAVENAKATEMHQSVLVERTSQPVVPKPLLANNAFDALLKPNASSANRHSVIEGLQKQLFPNGKLPPQRPPQPNLGTTRPFGTVTVEANTEPKLQKDGEASAKLLVSTSSIVKSRTNIAPSNKRPPSKVNSAATLLDADSHSPTLELQNALPSASVTKKAIQEDDQPSSEEVSGAPSNGILSAVSACPAVTVSSTAPSNKTTVFSTRPSSPVLQPTPILCAVSDDHHQHIFSSSPTNVVNKQLRAQHSPQLPLAADHPNFISRAEFDLYKEEQERKLVALQAELKELRCKMID